MRRLALLLLALLCFSSPAQTQTRDPTFGLSGDCVGGPGVGTVASTCTNWNGIFWPSILRGYLAGCGTSNDSGTPNTVIDIANCSADDDTYTQFMTQNAFTKNMNAAWASGTGSGCLDTGSSLSASTWYFIYEIWGSGQTVDYLCSKQTFGTVTFPTNYTLKRAVGVIETDGSSHILAFVQDEDTWYYQVNYQDINITNQAASASLVALTIPPGFKVRPYLYCEATGANWFVTSPDMPDLATATVFTNSPGANQPTSTGLQQFSNLFSNTAKQIRVRPAGTTNTLTCYTSGFVWTRGKLN